MNRTLTILIAGLSLLACLSLHGQITIRTQTQPPHPPYGSHASVIQDLEKAQLVDDDGKKRGAMHYLRGMQFIGLYFSAHWCPPCRAFTPELVKFRNYCHKNDIPFEVVFVSFDQSEKEMRKYMHSMKMRWPAAPFKSDLAKQLKQRFQVGSIPTLIILNWRGEVVTANGRSDVHLLGKDAYQKWQKTSLLLQAQQPPWSHIQPQLPPYQHQPHHQPPHHQPPHHQPPHHQPPHHQPPHHQPPHHQPPHHQPQPQTSKPQPPPQHQPPQHQPQPQTSKPQPPQQQPQQTKPQQQAKPQQQPSKPQQQPQQTKPQQQTSKPQQQTSKPQQQTSKPQQQPAKPQPPSSKPQQPQQSKPQVAQPQPPQGQPDAQPPRPPRP